MADAPHYLIIGNGMAGTHAATTLRERDADCDITVVSAGALLFYNRYDLPSVFRGCESWVDLLVHPPEFYEEQRIRLRRKSLVADVDGKSHIVVLGHREAVRYDRLLVATGGEAFLPEQLKDARGLMHYFNTFKAAVATRDALPAGGKVVMLGGDMIGLDLARTLIDTGYDVTLVAGGRTFWPHEVAAGDRPGFYDALQGMGVHVVRDARVTGVEEGAPGMPARQVLLDGAEPIRGDVVMPFFGLAPNVDFMGSSGVDMERGILCDARLRSSNEEIWAAGDVCQIWSDETRAYRFFYGYDNVRRMGEVAARNMTGDDVAFEVVGDERLRIDEDGRLRSPFWEHE